MLTAHQMSRDHIQLRLESTKLIIAADNLAPDLALDGGEGVDWRPLEQQLPSRNNCHPRAQFADIIHDMCRKDYRDIPADRTQQIQEAVPLGGIKARGG